MSERCGSDIERLWNLISRSTQNRLKMASFVFRVVLCRIRLFPTLISKIKWLWPELPLKWPVHDWFKMASGWWWTILFVKMAVISFDSPRLIWTISANFGQQRLFWITSYIFVFSSWWSVIELILECLSGLGKCISDWRGRKSTRIIWKNKKTRIATTRWIYK